MTLGTVLTILFFLLFMTALVSGLVLYIQFCNSVEKQWATEVLNLYHDAERRVRSENRQLRELKAERDTRARSLHEEAFAAHLCDYAVDQLEAYPGIGPGTVSKLRAAGFVNLATLHRAHICIHGLGEKRLADINHAVRILLGKARATFDAGECQKAQALADRLEALSTHYDRLERQSRIRARATEEFLNHIEKTVEYARTVTFWQWFRPISNEALIPAEVMDAPLPNLEKSLRAAEHRIARNGTSKRPQVEAPTVPVMPISSPRPIVSHAQAPKQTSATTPHAGPEMPDETHLVLMELTIQFALGVARADGPVTWTERELIQQHTRKRFSYNRALLNRAEAFLAQYETAAIDWERCLAEINRRFTVEHRIALIGFASQIVSVSGNDVSRASPFLHHLAQRLGVPPVALPQQEKSTPSLVPFRDMAAPALDLQPHRERSSPSLVPPKSAPRPASAEKPVVPQKPAAVRVAAAASPVAPRPSQTAPAAPPKTPLVTSPPPAKPVMPSPKPVIPTRNECLALLEISPGTPLSADLVRRQWNLLSEKMAPEKVASLGAEFVKLAQTKLVALRQAAASLLEAMGEKLETKAPAPPVQDMRHNPDLDGVFGGM